MGIGMRTSLRQIMQVRAVRWPGQPRDRGQDQVDPAPAADDRLGARAAANFG